MSGKRTESVHLICGSTGAGKTTYSKRLAEDLKGVHLSIDEWMVRLFGEDAPETLTPAWFVPRTHRCEDQMWAMVVRLASLGVPSILDFGFQRREHRQKYAARAKAAQLSAKLHVLDLDAQERWRRVQARNENQGETYEITITRGMFDYIETIWEPPGRDELRLT